MENGETALTFGGRSSSVFFFPNPQFPVLYSLRVFVSSWPEFRRPGFATDRRLEQRTFDLAKAWFRLDKGMKGECTRGR